MKPALSSFLHFMSITIMCAAVAIAGRFVLEVICGAFAGCFSRDEPSNSENLISLLKTLLNQPTTDTDDQAMAVDN